MSTKFQHTINSLSYYNFTDIIPPNPWRDLQPQLRLPVLFNAILLAPLHGTNVIYAGGKQAAGQEIVWLDT